MDKLIQINVTDRRAQALAAPVIICGNSGYQVQFVFDDEWATVNPKTARFAYVRDGKVGHQDIVFEGNTAEVPVLSNIREVRVGVFAGDLVTTTPAVIPCEPSILCGSGLPDKPTEDVYTQLMGLYNQKVMEFGTPVENVFDEESTNAASGMAIADALSIYDEVIHKELVKAGGNLFDKTSSDITQDAYINPHTVDENRRDQSGRFITPYIRVNQGATYATLADANYFGEPNALKVAAYNSSKEYIGFLTGACIDATDLKAYQIALTVNASAFTPLLSSAATVEDVAYIRLTYSSLFIDSYMVVKGTEYPSEYVVYGKNVYHLSINPDGIGNKLTGKVVSFIGDSICAGHYVDEAKTETLGGYGKIIAERNGMTYENLGVHGSTIASGTGKNCISTSVENARADADYIILEGGVNDASLNVALGSITDGYAASLDLTTFAGAFENMLKAAILRFPGRKIGYIFTHKISPRYLATDLNGDAETHYTIARKCCEKWGVPYIDLNASSPLSRYIEPLKNTYTNNQDGWHPNEEGYLKYYCDPIEHWMLGL